MEAGAALRAAAAAVLLGAGAASAQVPVVDPASLGLGGHDVATVRGPGAVAANPAGLGLGSGALSVALLPGAFRAGLDPVTLGDLAEWDGASVPPPVRHAWLERIVREGEERGSATLGVAPFAVSFGRVGVQLSTLASGRVRLGPDAAELLLFGNAGLTGEPRTFQLEGSRLDGWVVSSLAVAHGRPVAEIHGGRLAVGATISLVMGHALVVARDVGTTLGGEPLEGDVRLPVLSNPTGDGFPDHGYGVALDVGAAWESERLDLGLTLRSVVNSFAWELGGLVYRPGTAIFDAEDSESDFDERPAIAAPAALRDAVEGMRFGPTVEAGVGYRLRSDVRVVGSGGVRFGDDLVGSPGAWIGGGVEVRRWRRLPVRGHLTVARGGVELGAGATVVLGPVRVGVAGALARGGGADGSSIAFGLGWRSGG